LKKPNVVLIVLDTLRGDYAGGLDELKAMGFLKLDAVAPSSWTLPSHVSMFTSELPSAHGVREYSGVDWEEMMRISRARLGSNTLLESLKQKGYTTYGYSANLFVTPQFGFAFDEYKLFNQAGVIKETPGPAKPKRSITGMIVPLLFREDALGGLLRWLALDVFGTLLEAVGVHQLEKGSKPIENAVRDAGFEEPFFAFINLMEAHQPYVWWILDTLTVRASLLGKPPRMSWWRRVYPQHSALSVSRGIEIASIIMKYDPLVIITSDHGQLLGEEGRFGHGFSLDEALLRVPIYVRFPGGRSAIRAEGPVVSLAEVPKMIDSVVEGEACHIGAEFALAESWGEGNYRTGGITEVRDMHKIFMGRVGAGRVKVAAQKGSVIVNRKTGAIEEVLGDLTPAEAEELSKKIPGQAAPKPTTSAPGITSSDEELVLGRLKQLGYE